LNAMMTVSVTLGVLALLAGMGAAWFWYESAISMPITISDRLLCRRFLRLDLPVAIRQPLSFAPRSRRADHPG
jgi:hypothetical protein